MFNDKYGPWAVVAGASDGTGAAFVDELGRRGVNVVLVARREQVLEEVAGKARAEHGIETRTVVLDMSDDDAPARLAEATADLEVGLLAYNVGADTRHQHFFDTAPEDLDAFVRRNCQSVVRATHHFGRAMRERGRGGIVLVTSGAGWAGGAHLAIYGSSKAFQIVLAEALWAENRAKGVDVLALVLGVTDTPATQRYQEVHGVDLGPGADPLDVVRQGLDQLPEGPTFSPGMPDPGASPFGAMSRRDAVQIMSGGV